MKHLREDVNDQSKFWNGSAGRAWTDVQPLLDSMFKPFEQLLVETVCTHRSHHVLDVGCGTGGTTLAIARGLDPKGSCTGIDISAPMIDAATARACNEGTPANFIRADAQTYDFSPASFDAIISRFGVMFFSDFVKAFTNLRNAARDGAKLTCIAWRDPEENPFMTTAERATAPLLNNIPDRTPNEPGQFAFADRDRVLQIFKQSGWMEIGVESIDVTCRFPAQELSHYVAQLGPVGRILEKADAETIARVVTAVLPSFQPFVYDGEVRFNAACWMVRARA